MSAKLWILLLASTAACGGANCPPAPAPVEAQPVAATERAVAEPAPDPEAPHQSAGPHISELDCRVDSETKQGERLRGGNNGGPMGATWNWNGPLRCWVKVSGPCSDEDASAKLEFGLMEAMSAALRRQDDVLVAEFVVNEALWFEETKSFMRPTQGYAGVPLTVYVMAECEGSNAAALSDSFVGRFAFGD